MYFPGPPGPLSTFNVTRKQALRFGDGTQHIEIIGESFGYALGVINDNAAVQGNEGHAHCDAVIIVGIENRGFGIA